MKPPNSPIYFKALPPKKKTTAKECSGRCYTLGSESGSCGSGCGSARPPRRGRKTDESQPQRFLISSDPEIPFRAAATRRMARSQNRGVEVKGKPRKVSGGYLPFALHLPNWLPRWWHRRHDSLGRRAKPNKACFGTARRCARECDSGAEASSTGNAGARACVVRSDGQGIGCAECRARRIAELGRPRLSYARLLGLRGITMNTFL